MSAPTRALVRPFAGLLVALGCLLAGCSSHHAAAAQSPAAIPATVRTADCAYWKSAAPAQRTELVRGMRAFFGAHVDAPGTLGKALPDRQAVSLFDGYCGQSYARAFTLYRIYGNAAAFTAPHK